MKRTLPIALAFFVSAAAFGQAVDPWDFKVADILILQSRKVQDDIGITESMRNRMNTFAEEHSKAMKAYNDELVAKKIPIQKDPNGEKRLEALFNRLKTNVFGIMTGAQVRRLREITLQRAGTAAFIDPLVANHVGLTANEASAVKQVYSAAQKQSAELVEKTVGPIRAKFNSKKPKSAEEANLYQAQANLELKNAMEKAKPTLNKYKASAEAKIKAIVPPKAMAAFKALCGKPSKAIDG